jgi:hypothetical protein
MLSSFVVVDVEGEDASLGTNSLSALPTRIPADVTPDDEGAVGAGQRAGVAAPSTASSRVLQRCIGRNTV